MKKISKPEVRETQDGSDTLYSSFFDQAYHNQQGAVSESKHIFFEKNGLKEALKNRDKIDILEIGFGTGLNLLLLLNEYLETTSSAAINYHAVEAFPPSPRTIEKLNYESFINNSELFQKIPPLFKSLEKGMNGFQILPNLSLNIFYGPFDSYRASNLKFDYIFHDAFSPRANPELWTRAVFKKLLNITRNGAVLTTYCAASKVRGAMAAAGWHVARAEGALRKREMTVASPSETTLQKYKRVNEKRLGERYKNNEFS